jgi:hypothetical protein
MFHYGSRFINIVCFFNSRSKVGFLDRRNSVFPGVILSECAHEDHGDEADEEDDHHERVEYREPVDLKGISARQLKKNRVMLFIRIHFNSTL